MGVPLKVIVWGTGGVGKIALREVLRNKDCFELVGVKAHDEAKIGVDAGLLCGEGVTGILASGDVGALPLAETDCVLYCPRVTDYDVVEMLLRSGVNVVTTASNVYPKFYGPELVERLNAAGQAGDASYHGSGINPAFVSDVLPLTLSGLTHQARKITVREVSDVNHAAVVQPEIMCDHIGFGKTPAEALLVDDFLKGMNDYFGESILAIADALGVTVDRIEEHHELAVATEPVTLESGRVIETGTVGCRRFEWRGIIDGAERIVLSTYWKVTDRLEPAWDVQASNPVEWTVIVEGTPSFRCILSVAASFDEARPDFKADSEEAAFASTATHALNAVPFVVRAQPGVRTFLDLPIITAAGAFRDRAPAA